MEILRFYNSFISIVRFQEQLLFQTDYHKPFLNWTQLLFCWKVENQRKWFCLFSLFSRVAVEICLSNAGCCSSLIERRLNCTAACSLSTFNLVQIFLKVVVALKKKPESKVCRHDNYNVLFPRQHKAKQNRARRYDLIFLFVVTAFNIHGLCEVISYTQCSAPVYPRCARLRWLLELKLLQLRCQPIVRYATLFLTPLSC